MAVESTQIVVVGGGGFGREVVSAVLDCPQTEVLGVVDDGVPSLDALGRLGVPYLGGFEALDSLPARTAFVVAVGSPRARLELAQRTVAAGHVPACVVHPHASVGRDVRLGRGSVVMPGAVLTANIDLGDFSIVNCGVLVGHDSVIGEAVTINPGCIVADDVVIGSGTFVGAASLLARGCRVEPNSVVVPGSRLGIQEGQQ